MFGADGSHLARYATRFRIAEINSSFYRPHAAATYARWAASVPGDFRFSVKLPRAVTHDARLQRVGPLLSRFADEVSGLGTHLGGVLVQLPPSLSFDPRIADTFFAMLRRRLQCGLACEPRHASWFEPRVAALWARYQVTRVAADPARVAEAAMPAGAGRWRYWRWHGSPRMYYDGYDDARLQALAQALLVEAAAGRQAWCIFDNTAAGHAMGDAARLQAMIAVATPRRPVARE